MTDVSSMAQTNAPSCAKSINSNNEKCHLISDTAAAAAALSLTNGTTKVNNTSKSKIAKNKQNLPAATAAAVPTTANTTVTNKMSTVGVKSQTPTTQSPATTPSQTLVSYDTNSSTCSTTIITTSNQILFKPALQTERDSISTEISVTTVSSTSTPTITKCDSNIEDNKTTTSSTNSCCTSPTNNSFSKQSHKVTTGDIDEVARLYEERPEAFEIWLMERAPSEALVRLQEFIESRKQRLKRPSVTSGLFQQWMTSSPIPKNRSLISTSSSSHSVFDNRRHLMELDEGELFMELIRDVANELDIDVLCHKILVNVGLLTHADRGSLFLAKGPPNNRYLVAKLFDVTQKTANYNLHTNVLYAQEAEV